MAKKKKSGGQSKRVRQQAKRKERQGKQERRGGPGRFAMVDGEPVPMPPPYATEQVMRSMFGAPDSPELQAQNLAYEAMDALAAGEPRRAMLLADQAMELDPGCIDALMVLAKVSSDTLEELVEKVEHTVQTAERMLGKRFFKENRGDFWGILETRPYMRARETLAQLLRELGRTDEAISHYEDMLDLNPGDNQAVRYELLGLYLQTGRFDAAGRLFDQYPDEGSAMFAWGRVLERRLSGDAEGAESALVAARQTNRHVEPLLTARKHLPREMPSYYSYGDETEATVCVSAIGAAWKQHPEAIAWLKEQRPT